MEKSVVNDYEELDNLFNHYLFDIDERQSSITEYIKEGMSIKKYQLDNHLYMYKCSQASDTNNQFPVMEFLSTDPISAYEEQTEEDPTIMPPAPEFYIQRTIYPSGNRECMIYMGDHDSLGYIKYSNDPNIALSYSLPGFSYDELFENTDSAHLNNPLRILKYAATHDGQAGYNQSMYTKAYHSLSTINSTALNEIKEYLFQRAYFKLSNRPNLFKMRYMLDLSPDELQGILQAGESQLEYNKERLTQEKMEIISKIIDTMKTNERLEDLIRQAEEELSRGKSTDSDKDRE